MQETVTKQASSFEALFAAAIGLDRPKKQLSDAAIFDEEEGGKTEEDVQVIQLPSEVDTPATVGEQYKAIWKRYLKALNAWSDEQHAIRCAERKMVAPILGEYMRAFDNSSSDDVRNALVNRSCEIRKMLVWIAQKVFAPENVKLKIDDQEIYDRFKVNERNVENFNPIIIWSYLEQKYGGDFGAKLAWQQVAKGFKSKFNLDDGEEIVIKGGYIVLDRPVWLDDFDKKLYKKNRLQYGCVESINQSLNVLSEIARWSDRITLSHDLSRLSQTFSDRTYEILSRAKHPAGDNGEVIIVTYMSRFEFLIRQDFAEQLQVFLGTYLEIEP